ncbi:MAG: helix-turn-helix domain-containing protein [Chloroflexales bacterium]|nr:helix-turn-helix domain-containing protein [Chloroflexales bacterium]
MNREPSTSPTTQPLLLRVDEAARLLSLSRSKVYELLSAGILPVVVCGTARRIPFAALAAWVEAHTEYHP